MDNIDKKTVSSFSDEWTRYDQKAIKGDEQKYLFEKYFHIFPWSSLPKNANGFDMGCGSGRWAELVAPKIGRLTCIDASEEALTVAKRNLKYLNNIDFLQATVSEHPLKHNSQDFGYSLGVLHHIPNTAQALKDCVKILKPGAPFLLYLYYKFDNRPIWYPIIWRISDIVRRLISILPSSLKSFITNTIAITIYFPLARLAFLGEKIGLNVNNWLLASYRKTSFFTMRTDSRDRFGTPLEQRFTRSEISSMMQEAGLDEINFSNHSPFWCAVGIKSLSKT